MKSSRSLTVAAILLTSLLTLFSFQKVIAQGAEAYENGPVHEAFVTASTEGGVILQAIALNPPVPINESRPPQCDPEAIWIPGYWAWIKEIENFVWISGVWRIPPPDHIWISGYWKQFDYGWAWVRGFWSMVPENQLTYIADRPPEPRRENIPESPGDNYFWMPGYWEYDIIRRDYNWLSGRWTELDPNWIYVPAYYLWRPEGYLFVPAYWDYPIEIRGCAYSAVTIPPEMIPTIVYVPTIILEPMEIIVWCYGYYPDFSILFWHHWHFHPGFWGGWCCTPPWWDWPSCWCFSWSETWWLWWWWTNPGFPNPPWILANIAAQLPPPSFELLNMIGNVMPPPIIGPWGAVTPWELINQLGNTPVMPWDKKDLEKITGSLMPPGPKKAPLLPEGDPDKLKPLPRPPVGKGVGGGGKQVTPPAKPTAPPSQSDTPEQGYPPSGPPVSPPPTYVPPRRPPVYTPPSRPPSYKPPAYEPPRKPQWPPSYEPQEPSRPQRPPDYTPRPPRRPNWNQPQTTPSQPDRYTPQTTPSQPDRYTPQTTPSKPNGSTPQTYPPRGLRWRGSGKNFPNVTPQIQQNYIPRGMRPPRKNDNEKQYPNTDMQFK